MKMRWHAVSCLALLLSISLRGAVSDLTAAQDEGATPPASPPAQVLRSPDETIEISVTPNGPLNYSVRVDGQIVLAPSKLGLLLRGGTRLGADVELVNATRQSSDSRWENPLGKRRIVRDHYNELHLLLRERATDGRTFEVVFRAYDDGVAFRYGLLSQPGMREFVLDQELTEFAFPADFTCYAGEQEQGFTGPQEWEFQRRRLSDIKTDSIIGLPLLVESPFAWLAIAEADLSDWAGMWLGGAADPPAPTEPIADAPHPIKIVTKLAPRADGDTLVEGKTPHRSPWRVVMVGRQPGRLVESEIIRNLSSPSQLPDISWIKPGMMAWGHGWTGDIRFDLDSLESSIELAAAMGWPYQLIDGGWYGKANRRDANITQADDKLDLVELRAFAAEKGVRLWLSVHWSDLDRKDAYLQAFPIYNEWGIAGVKIDGVDRDDQPMVEWCEKMTRAAAENQLLVSFHGAYKPSGFDRTLPNQITRKAILGNEHNKSSARVTPEHKVTLPFTRLLVGPADFTPGGFLNRQPGAFQPQQPTLVQGTRAAELALFVVYDSPVSIVCDHPDHYRDQAGADFLKIVPTVWDDTHVLDGVVGQQIVVARKSGDAWFLGALTNSQARDVTIKLDFLGSGSWRLMLWHDADDADHSAEHLSQSERTVTAGDTLTLKLAPAGGCVGQFIKR